MAIEHLLQARQRRVIGGATQHMDAFFCGGHFAIAGGELDTGAMLIPFSRHLVAEMLAQARDGRGRIAGLQNGFRLQHLFSTPARVSTRECSGWSTMAKSHWRSRCHRRFPDRCPNATPWPW